MLILKIKLPKFPLLDSSALFFVAKWQKFDTKRTLVGRSLQFLYDSTFDGSLHYMVGRC